MAVAGFNAAGYGRPISSRRSALIVLTAALAMFLTNGFILLGMSMFDPVILDRLHVSVGALKTRDAVTFVTAALLSPLSGYMLDRIGVRPIMATGMIFMALGMYAYSGVTSLIQIYLIHILFGCCLVMAGLFVCIVLITGVTARHRGLAVGVVLAGSSLGAALAPKANALLEGAFGWQTALRAGAIPPLLLIPVILLIVPRRQTRKAAAIVAASEPAAPIAPSGLSYRAALRTPSFWLLAVIAMITFFAKLGIGTNLVLYVERQLGGSRDAASGALFIISMAALVVQLSAGALIDRIGAKPVHLVSIVLMGLGIGALAFAPPGYLLLIVTLIGAGWGGNYAALQFSTSNLFAGSSIGRILATINVIEAVGAGLGPAGIGLLYDVTGSFAAPFGIASVLVLLSSIAVALVASPKGRNALASG